MQVISTQTENQIKVISSQPENRIQVISIHTDIRIQVTSTQTNAGNKVITGLVCVGVRSVAVTRQDRGGISINTYFGLSLPALLPALSLYLACSLTHLDYALAPPPWKYSIHQNLSSLASVRIDPSRLTASPSDSSQSFD